MVFVIRIRAKFCYTQAEDLTSERKVGIVARSEMLVRVVRVFSLKSHILSINSINKWMVFYVPSNHFTLIEFDS